MNQVYQTLVTTPEFERGRQAARGDAMKFGEIIPNDAVLDRFASSEFAAGYRNEAREFNSYPEDFRVATIRYWKKESKK